MPSVGLPALRIAGLSFGISFEGTFCCVYKDVVNPSQRVVLARSDIRIPLRRIDVDYYRRLAVRAIWSVLAPFGWSEEQCLSRQLFGWTTDAK